MNPHHLAIVDVDPTQVANWQRPLLQAFGFAQTEEMVNAARIMEHRVRLGIEDQGEFIASLAWFDFELTVPGGKAVPMAALTCVAVDPTHRRQGLMRRLMDEGLLRARAAKMPIAGLFASDGAIYGRFGFALASWWMEGNVSRHHAALVPRFSSTAAVKEKQAIRRLSEEQALAVCSALWDRLRPQVPGMLSRPPYWWKLRRLREPVWRRANTSPLLCYALYQDEKPQGYVIMRIGAGMIRGMSNAKAEILEIVGLDAEVVASLWDFVVTIDLQQTIAFFNFSPDHPVLCLAKEPAAFGLQVMPALYLRILDLQAALRCRTYGPGEVVIKVHDRDFADNNQVLRISADEVKTCDAAPELELEIASLSAIYLGSQTFHALAQAGQIKVHSLGALTRADALFTSTLAPWCADQF